MSTITRQSGRLLSLAAAASALLVACNHNSLRSLPPGFISDDQGRRLQYVNYCTGTCGYPPDPYPADFGVPGGGGAGGDGPSGGGTISIPPNSGLKHGCGSDDSTAKRQISMHYNDALSANRSDPSHDHEFVGYIYEDANGSVYFRDLGIYAVGSNGTVAVPTPGTWQNFTFVGWYHTHPDQYNFGNGNGVDPSTGLHFSGPDISFSNQYGTGYVGESNDVGPYSNDPNSWTAQQSFQWYSYTPTAPIGSKESSKGSFSPGSSSCT